MSTPQERDNFAQKCYDEQKNSVAIDFDGVIMPVGGDPIKPSLDVPPLSGAKEALETISKSFSRVVLHTCRARTDRPESAVPHIEAWLEKYGLAGYFSEITSDKPRVSFYIDDKGVRHTDWSTTLMVMGLEKPFKAGEVDNIEASHRAQLYNNWNTDSCQIRLSESKNEENWEKWTQ